MTIPASVIVGEGLTTATFDVSATPVEEEMSAVVYATYRTSQTSTTLVIAPPLLAGLTVSPSTVVGGNALTADVTLNAPAGGEGASVTMASSHPEVVSTPLNIVVPAGQTTASAALTTSAVEQSTEVVVSATRHGITKSVPVTVAPASALRVPGAGVTAIAHRRTITRMPSPMPSSRPAVLCASLALPPCVTTTAAAIPTIGTDDQDPIPPSTTEREYYLYTPELSLLAETAPSTATTPPIAWEYIWFAGEPLAQINATTGDIHYYLTDHLGTPILQTDASASIIWQAEYEPYGEIHAFRHGESKHQPLRFPGQEARDGGDTAYNVFRWYRAGWGRYTQADPDLLVRTATEESQWYGYALLNPKRYIDPLGLYTVSGSCAKCESLDPNARNLSEYLLEGVSRWCREERHLVTDVRLRECMTENCRSGRIECESCDEDGLFGYSETRDTDFHHWLARRSPNRTVHICLNASGNYGPEGANTVVHEWAHGCGCNPHGGGCSGIPDEPTSPEYEHQRRTRRIGGGRAR